MRFRSFETCSTASRLANERASDLPIHTCSALAGAAVKVNVPDAAAPGFEFMVTRAVSNGAPTLSRLEPQLEDNITAFTVSLIRARRFSSRAAKASAR